jgi:hypothetical protein
VKTRTPGLALLLPGLLAALLAAGVTGRALAQAGTLRGTVRSAQTGEPLAGPVVTVLAGELHADPASLRRRRGAGGTAPQAATPPLAGARHAA